MENISEKDDVRFLRLRYDSEGAGRFLVLTDENDYNSKGVHITLASPEDLRILYEAAKELWEQGSIYDPTEDW